MSLPTYSNVQPSARSGLWIGPSTGPFHDPSNFNEVFLGAFRRDVLSFYPGSRIEREPAVIPAGSTAPATPVSPTFALDFQLDEDSGRSRDSVRVALFGVWYRLSVPRGLGLGPRDHDLIRAVGRVMELHHQVLSAGRAYRSCNCDVGCPRTTTSPPLSILRPIRVRHRPPAGSPRRS